VLRTASAQVSKHAVCSCWELALAGWNPLDVAVEEATLLGLEPVEERISCSQEQTQAQTSEDNQHKAVAAEVSRCWYSCGGQHALRVCHVKHWVLPAC
jgi:hypothetical protein